MKLLNRVKKSQNKKGFTLVELIVVLVILAILAAILVPALLGYIDKAKEKQIVLNAKSCYTAAQAEFSDLYAQDYDLTAGLTATQKKDILDTADSGATALTVGTDEAAAATYADKATAHKAYTITYVYFKSDDGEIWFDGSSWVNEAPTAPTGSYTVK